MCRCCASEWRADAKRATKAIEKALKYPLFVKPANLGSSVGISKVHNRAELAPAMDLAASFDRKIVIEQGVGGPGVKPRELEVAVLGNDAPEASVVGEIVPAKEFYDYEAKYELSGPDESVSLIPAKLTKAEEKKIRAMAIAAFRACDCAGLARVDFLMAPAAQGQALGDRAERDQHDAGLHLDQHVPEAVGSERPAVCEAHRPADRAWHGAASREAGDALQPLKERESRARLP